MKLYSTNSPNQYVTLKEAVMKGLPADNGLFMPKEIPLLPKSFIDNLKNYSFQEIAFTICKALFNGAIPESDVLKITNHAVNFPAPLVELDSQTLILELFHGPSLAFKDFGARFMAQLMSYFNQSSKRELVILVATSGDTGGAVASGFYKTPGIKVVILYPSGKVSNLQEKQLTTLGHNIQAIEIDGTFDDCQALVKNAFLDEDLNNNIQLSSANSINIARLIPQSFYYFEAFKQVKKPSLVTFCVPSGNFGNLTAGILAKKMGLPIHHFIAATNINDIVPEYLRSGVYSPKKSVRTISNAMDVGNPSNFARMLDLYCSTWNIMKDNISGFSFTDQQTKEAIKEIYDKFGYIIDPHGAVGYLALKKYKESKRKDDIGIILETAHPSKFIEDVSEILQQVIHVPERLAILANKDKEAVLMNANYQDFKNYLNDNYS